MPIPLKKIDIYAELLTADMQCLRCATYAAHLLHHTETVGRHWYSTECLLTFSHSSWMYDTPTDMSRYHDIEQPEFLTILTGSCFG